MRQARKYALTARRGAAEEAIDLVVFNPGWERGSRRPDFFLFPTELPFVQRAIVSIKGWHVAGRFTPGTLRNQPEIFRFLEQNVLKEAITLSPPPIVKNRELRFFDFRQIGNCPPAFLIEINDRMLIRQAYRRFLENNIRRHFDFTGTHIELVFYEKRKRSRR